MSSPADPAVGPFIKQACKQLRLPSIGFKAESLAQEAARTNQSHLSYLAALLEVEMEDRSERRRHRRAPRPSSRALSDWRTSASTRHRRSR